MRYVLKYFTLFTILFLFNSCEDVIDVDLPTTEPRLVVEANINWEKGSLGNSQEIILSLSTDYFSSDKFVPATGATVEIVNLYTSHITNSYGANGGGILNLINIGAETSSIISLKNALQGISWQINYI